MRAPSFMVITGASIARQRVRKRHRHPPPGEAERRLDKLPPGQAAKVAGKRTKAGRQSGYRERCRTDGVMHEPFAERHRERDLISPVPDGTATKQSRFRARAAAASQ